MGYEDALPRATSCRKVPVRARYTAQAIRVIDNRARGAARICSTHSQQESIHKKEHSLVESFLPAVCYVDH
jgi:hypothetical protein